MMSLAKQVYDYYFRPYLGEKGQDMVEYALMLAIIVGIGWLIYQQSGIANSINNVFTNADNLMGKQICSADYLTLSRLQRASAQAGVLWKGGQWFIGRFSKE